MTGGGCTTTEKGLDYNAQKHLIKQRAQRVLVIKLGSPYEGAQSAHL